MSTSSSDTLLDSPPDSASVSDSVPSSPPAGNTSFLSSQDDQQLSRRKRRPVSAFYASPRALSSSRTSALPPTLEPLDLPPTTPTPNLASLRTGLLAYLSDLEARLHTLASPISPVADWQAWRNRDANEITEAVRNGRSEEARTWAKAGLETIRHIRADVRSYLPDLRFEFDGVEYEDRRSQHRIDDGSSRIQELPSPTAVPSFDDIRLRFTNLPKNSSTPSRPRPSRSLSTSKLRLEDVRSHLPNMPNFSAFNIANIGPRLDSLSSRLDSLQAHLSNANMPKGLRMVSTVPSGMLSEMLDRVLLSDQVFRMNMIDQEEERSESLREKAAKDIAYATKLAMDGENLIDYDALPQKWKNNHFVLSGYRFIPLERWPLILHSVLQLHNETANIHTHFLPFLFWLLPILHLSPAQAPQDVPELLFTLFALFCLFNSSVWHTMSGCAHPKAMERCARVDYVGIGWLISASVATVMYYGFANHPTARNLYLLSSFCTGVAGTILPFMSWFNGREYRRVRMAFFVTITGTALCPLFHLAYIFSWAHVRAFMTPVMPSIYSYIYGLIFYASHFPECYLSENYGHWLDLLGGGSHAIWHMWIVRAIALHRASLPHLAKGIETVLEAR